MDIKKVVMRPEEAHVVLSIVHGDMSVEEFKEAVSNPLVMKANEPFYIDLDNMEAMRRGYSINAIFASILLEVAFGDQVENLQDFMSQQEPLITSIPNLSVFITQFVTPVVINQYRMHLSSLVDKQIKDIDLTNVNNDRDMMNKAMEYAQELGMGTHKQAYEQTLYGFPSIFAAMAAVIADYQAKGYDKIALFAFRDEKLLKELAEERERTGTLTQGSTASEQAYDDALNAMMEANKISFGKKK